MAGSQCLRLSERFFVTLSGGVNWSYNRRKAPDKSSPLINTQNNLVKLSVLELAGQLARKAFLRKPDRFWEIVSTKPRLSEECL